MLKMKKTTTISGSSIIDGVVAEGYNATIDSSNPADMSMNSWQQDKALYKVNRAQCRADKAEFEDAVYAIQDEMIAALEASEE